jgi:Domain of unknown function (DUF4868)
MSIALKFDAKTVTEFGVGLDNGKEPRFVSVPVDGGVQNALQEMAVKTRDQMIAMTDTPATYEPSEKPSAIEHLHLPLADELATQIRLIHEAVNLPSDVSAVANPENIFCYFARMSDEKGGGRVTAIRRANTFKGVLHSRVVTWMTDSLKIVKENVFKLDNDFDLLVDATGVYIFRPAGFEFIGKLNSAILQAASSNIVLIQKEIKFVDFECIGTYASTHPRAARYLASIRAQERTKNIDKESLKALCVNTGVLFEEVNGKLIVAQGSIMDFLGVLDRRMYQVELVKGSPEPFRAANRSSITLKK